MIMNLYQQFTVFSLQNLSFRISELRMSGPDYGRALTLKYTRFVLETAV